MKPILLGQHDLLGTLAKWAIRQSPYHRPDGLEKVLDTVHSTSAEIFKGGSLGYIEFNTVDELETFIRDQVVDIPELLAWNEPKNPSDAPFKFTSRYDTGDDPDNDFIDLDALISNIVRDCLREYSDL